MFKKRNRKGTLFILSLLFLVLFSVPDVLAWLNTTAGDVDNELGFGKTGVEIEEDFRGWDLKEVTLKVEDQEDGVPVAARAMLIPRVVDEEGRYVEGDFAPLTIPADNKISMGDLVFEMDAEWEENWFYQDGFFYYRKVLAPGQATKPLLHSVYLTSTDAEIQRKYEDTQIIVDVMSQVLQAESDAVKEEWIIGISDDGLSLYPL